MNGCILVQFYILFYKLHVWLVKPHAVGYSTAAFKCRRRVFLDLRNNGIKFCGAAGKRRNVSILHG